MAHSRFILGIGAALVAIATAASSAHAVSVDSIIKFDLGNTNGRDIVLTQSGVLQTINQFNGGQFTGLDFVGPLSDITDIVSGALMTLGGVTLTGSAGSVAGTVAQATTGGSFSLYSPSNALLLSGVLNHGTITGGAHSSTGAFFADFAVFTGGSLLPRLQRYPVGISIAFTDITSVGGTTGIPMLCATSGGCRLAGFTADGNGLVSGAAAVPEPFTGGLLLSGLVAGLAARRRISP